MHMRMLSILMLACLVLRVCALDDGEARHFLARTGFGATPAEIAVLLPLTREQAVDALLLGIRTTPSLPPPAWCTAEDLGTWTRRTQHEWQEYYALTGEAQRKRGDELRGVRDRQGHELKAWWWRELATTPSPFTERLVLLWHNHFTSSLTTVEDPRLMYEQNAWLRRHAAGSFAELLAFAPYDPALFRYLDGNSNRAGHANENFAREVMELFALGEGNYGEHDVQEAARAFTGYQFDDATGSVTKRDDQHDAGYKTVLGKKAVLDADGMMKLLLERHERVAITVCEKLWRAFISDDLDVPAIYALAGVCYREKYALKPTLRALLLLSRFWAPETRGTLVKAPVELLLSALHPLALPPGDGALLAQLGARCGQDLFDPPNVKGWSGGDAWLGSQGLLARSDALETILAGKLGARAGKSWLDAARAQGAAGSADLQRVLLTIPPVRPLAPDATFDAALRQLVLDPAFQVR